MSVEPSKLDPSSWPSSEREPTDASVELAWAKRIRRGDHTAFEALFRAYYERLCAFAEGYVDAPEVAEELVRQRPDVDMPPVTQGASQAELRRIVRHERMVELAMEGLRFFDLRRWETAHEVMQGPIPGMRYIRSGEGEVSTLDYGGVVRTFNPDRDYLWPIPQQELVLNPNLTQNPGY